MRRLLDAYTAIFLACHRRHPREDAHGNIVTEHQASILDHLHTTRAITPSKLAEHMGVSRSTISIALTRLVRSRYVLRKRDPQDARRASLTLTPAGARIQDENSILDPDLVNEMLRAVPPHELEAALQGLERLARSANLLLKKRKREHDK
ncbi:MAG: MarR family winged helix-turn-helix transcriptional regulator [Acidobacteriaceae bacterium]